MSRPVRKLKQESTSRKTKSSSIAPDLFVRWSTPGRITPVYDTYWKFAFERQEVFFRRLEGAAPPWTKDSILQSHRFTNVYRASDRVSQYLLRHVIYDQRHEPNDLLFRILLFKIFNKIETWERLASSLGPPSWKRYNYNDFDRILTKAMDSGDRIYSAAYIMPSGGRSAVERRKHRNHLRLIERIIRDDVAGKLAETKSMQQGFMLLRSYPTFGDFLAYQYITDINYSELTDYSEMEFTVPGPGARDGIRKCFSDAGGLTEPELIRLMAERQEVEFERLGLRFRTLWGRRLQLIDCQNLFCEVDKYSRVKHPDIVGITGRTKIKQQYRRNESLLDVWYPPKWGLNERVLASGSVNRKAQHSGLLFGG